MTKKIIFHAMVLCGVAGMALLTGGCVADGGYVSGGAVYSDVGYAPPLYVDRGPYYGSYGPAYSETVVIDAGSRHGRYSDGRRPYRASRYDGRRNGGGGSGSGYVRGRATQYGRSRQGSPTGRGGAAQFQRSRQGGQGRAAVRGQRGSGNAGRAQQQQEERGR